MCQNELLSQLKVDRLLLFIYYRLWRLSDIALAGEV